MPLKRGVVKFYIFGHPCPRFPKENKRAAMAKSQKNKIMKNTILIFALSILCQVAFSATIHVTVTNDEDDGPGALATLNDISFTEAIKYSQEGDVIQLPAGVFASGERDIKKNLSIIGVNSSSTIIEFRLFVHAQKTVSIKNLSIQNITTTHGGDFAIYLGHPSTLNLERVHVTNIHGQGSAIGGDGYINITDCSFVNNSTTSGEWGGAMGVGVSATIKGTSFKNNRASAGGAIRVPAGLANITLIDCTFEENKATGAGVASGLGGAIYIGDPSNVNGASGNLIIDNCTFYKNEANYSGAAITILYANTNSKLQITNTTFSENRHNNVSFRNLHIHLWYCKFAPTSKISHCTFKGDGIHGIYDEGNTGLNIENSLFDTDALYFYRHLSEELLPANNWGKGRDGDPMLLPLADNGGPTKTHALAPNSPAINAGTLGSTHDQRGIARNAAAPDPGAYEYIAPGCKKCKLSFRTKLGGNGDVIKVSAKGGYPPYQYSKDGGQTYQSSNVFEGLTTGTYTLAVKDKKNCESKAQAVSIEAGQFAGFYEIRPGHSNLLLTPHNHGTADGTEILQWNDENNPSQEFQLEWTGNGAYYIKNKKSGKYLGVLDGIARNGMDNIRLYTKEESDAQKFKLVEIPNGNGKYYIASQLNENYVLTIPSTGTNPGAKLGLWTNAAQPHQQFIVVAEQEQ